MSRKLPNYLRTLRKRAGLLQKEIALLLGLESDATVSRHELFQRLSILETILAYEVIFGVPVRELFGGVFEEVNKDVVHRAKLLLDTLQEQEADQATARKLEFLKAIITDYQNNDKSS